MILGITGGVGCGKSEILSLLASEYGAHIIKADDVAKDLMHNGTKIDKQVKNAFPETVDNDGNVDRTKLAEIVFPNEKNLSVLNSIVHPVVKEAIKNKISVLRTDNKDAFIVIEAALLIEAGYRDICDVIWYIHCERIVREHRLKVGRGYTKERIDNIIARQLSEEKFRKFSDYTIDNSGGMDDTLFQIKSLLRNCRIK